MSVKNRPRNRVQRAVGAVSVLGLFVVATGASISLHGHPVRFSATVVADSLPRFAPASTGLVFLDSLLGRSGKLRARFVEAASPNLPILSQLFGDSAGQNAGVYEVNDSSATGKAFAFITMRPFADKKNGRIGSYRIGYWPGERRATRGPSYTRPDGFVEVTPENQDTYVSEHFRLRDFLTHDQETVWPKYVVVDARLLDKLELLIDELGNSGLRVDHMSVLSGFRTPQYNVKGVGEGGRAKSSRHQYGDAADVFVDNDGDGRMDDLNGDGRVDHRDARVILDAAERVEQSHPDLAGGVAVYSATKAHGPFAHIDARGSRVRWGKL
ncbi:MAG: hypothetical protein ABR543_14605 [Gemmatimonadaceae bacterium]